MRHRVSRLIFPRQFVHWIGPILTVTIAAAVLALLVVAAGLPNLSASIPHPAGWADFLHFTFKRSTAAHARGITPPADLDSSAMVIKGAAYYDHACAHCHAAPGLGQNPIALAMRPTPQYLPQVVRQYTAPELFWIVKHGVKYSAMPAWPVQDRDDEVWSLVAFLRAMPRLNQTGYRALAQGPNSDAQGKMPMLPPGNSDPRGYALAGTTLQTGEQRATTPALAFGATLDSAEIAQTCAACHGADGAGRAGGPFPNIALLTREQIAKALNDYATGRRPSGFMQLFATSLTPDQINGLADYYARQPKRRTGTIGPRAPLLGLGEQVARRGLTAKGIGACASCHDYTRAIARAIPAIDGQNALYLRDQLRLYRSGIRGGTTVANQMYPIATRLSDREIDAVALYYASLMPAPPPK